MSENGESDSDSGSAGPSTSTGVKRKKYIQKYKKDWELRPELSTWLSPHLTKPNFAMCKSCNKAINISSGYDALKKHASSKIHEKSAKSLAVQPKLTEFVSKEVTQFNHQVKEGEIRIAGFVAEHNLPYAITDHLSKLISKICPDSKIAERLKCSRPRVQAVVENVIGEESFINLCEDLRKYKFSLVIDESTDLSTTKHLCLVARYAGKNNRIKYCFLALIQSSADATTLHESIRKFFIDNNIPYKENLIGFASDGANVMMAQRHSVMVLLQSEIPNLFPK